MKSIRIGNDIRIEWPIVLSGDVSKLQDLDLTVEVRPSRNVVDWHNYIEQPTLYRGKQTVMMNGGMEFRPDMGDGKEHCTSHRPKPPVPPVKLPYHIENNTLIAMWTADRQFAIGDYDIILYAHKNEGGQAVCDQYRFVRLVAHSAQADAPDDSGIEAVITMQPLTLSLSGLSAYEVAVVNGFQGSVEEWLESLKAGKLSSYVSVESIDNLPQQGDESTGYIIGTKLYIYVGTGGDTLEGKYKDVGEFRGPQGAPGSNGKSAYELAVEGGYEGSVEEWLLSLKGRDGVDGVNGADGLDGENGKDGVTPLIRWNNNRLEQSTDNGKSWWALSDKFNNKLYIKGYVTSADKLPKNALVGDMYGVGPIYGDDDVEQTKPYYQVYVNTVTDWAKSATITKVYQGDTELPQSAENNEIILIKKSTDNYLVYKYVNGSWNLLANLAEIYVEKDDIVNRGDNIFALVQSEIENQYELYERVVSWRNSGTFTSITAGIVNELGDSENAVMSQKAVTEKLNTINDKLDNQISEIEATKDAALNEIEDTEQEAISNFSAQRVTPEMLSEGVKQLIETAGGGTINNLPDEEDITSTGGDMPVLKFKDKEYNQEIFSGLGRVYLRKNIVGSKNVLTQDMINKENTFYIIRDDFDLDGKTIDVQNRNIIFAGGSINNGTLNCHNSIIQQFKGTANIVGNYKDNNFLYIDDEDIIKDNNRTLKFADKIYAPEKFSGLGRVYLRKNIVNGKNILTQNMVNDENTEYYVQYDYDLNNNNITIKNNSKLIGIGGKLSNGTLFTTNGYIDNSLYGDNISTTISYGTLNRVFSTSEDTLVLIMTDLPKPFEKYNLNNNGTIDNSINLNNLLNDSFFKKIAARYRNVKFIFNGNAAYNEKNEYLFNSPVKTEFGNYGTYNVDIILYADITFNFSETVPTISEIEKDGFIVPNYSLFNISSMNINIIGDFKRNDYNDTKRSYPIIKCLRNINGHYYEGYGNQFSSFKCSAFYSASQDTILNIKNICIDGFYHGVSILNGSANNIIVKNIIGDNGLTIGGTPKTPCYVTNCVFEDCQDLGLSIQRPNVFANNIIIDHCGNNNVPSSDNYGIDGSFNVGGGISIEANLTSNEKDLTVNINNVIIKNCFNYAIANTGGDGVFINNVIIKNIISTWNESYESLVGDGTFLHRATDLRKGGVFIIDQCDNIYINNVFVYGSQVQLLRLRIKDSEDVTTKNIFITNSKFQNIVPDFDFYNNTKDLFYIFYYNNFVKDCSSTYLGADIKTVGSTANRPILKNINAGFEYFDTTLNKPVWWNGTEWIDSEGNDVDSTPITSGTFANKPTGVDIGYAYFCTDKQTTEGTTNGIMIYYKGDNVWVDALGRVVS